MENTKGESMRFVGNALLTLLIVACLLVIVSNLGIGVLSFKAVLSGSMSPAINPGDFVVIYKTDKPVEIGDVVLFHDEGAEIIHRVVDETNLGYITKGDANEDSDSGAIRPSQVEGVYIARIPLLGYPLIFVKTGILQVLQALRGAFS